VNPKVVVEGANILLHATIRMMMANSWRLQLHITSMEEDDPKENKDHQPEGK